MLMQGQYTNKFIPGRFDVSSTMVKSDLVSLFFFFPSRSYFINLCMFNSVVAVAFQITFRVEMHANDIFFIFKKLFLTSAHQNDPKHINRIKSKKKLNFLKT